MTCSELEQTLGPYLDGEFGAAEQLEIERHLASCAQCARRVHGEAHFRKALRAAAESAAAVALPEGLPERVRQGLHREHRRAAVRRALPVATAAAVLAFAGGAYYYELRPSVRRSFLEDAAARHAKNLPIEVQVAAPEEVEAWFGGKLDRPVRVPRLFNARLAGARLSNVRDREAAYITYEVTPAGGGERRVGVFAFPDDDREVDAEPLPQLQVRQSRGYNVAIWREDGVVYQLVTDLDEADIRRMLLAQGRDAVYGTEHPPSPSLHVQQAGLRQ